MYPNVPTRRVRRDALPTLVSFANPKSATCIIKDSVQLCEKRLKMGRHHEKNINPTFPLKFLSISMFADLISR